VSRIVLVIGTLQAGGAERQLAEMANYLADAGSTVTLATWCSEECADFYPLAPQIRRVWLDSYRSHESGISRPWRFLNGMLRLRCLLRDERPDAVISFVDVSNIQTIVASAGLGLRVIVAERTHPAINFNISRHWRLLRRGLYSKASIVVAQTRDAAKWIEHECRARVEVIPNALRPLPVVNGTRLPLIIGVGRLSQEKGFDLLLRAFAELAPMFPEWRLAILGRGTYKECLLRLVEELDLTHKVEFAGQVENPESWMAQASLLVHPSRREGFPNVVLEAMAMACAVTAAQDRLISFAMELTGG
jgi:glycosyltransferase involved in cell wall biosynthesis